MAGNLRIVLNRRGVHALLTSPEAQADLARRGRNLAAAADSNAGEPGGHAVESSVGRNRARTAVYTDTPRAMRLEARDRTLSRAIDAARA